MIHPIRKIKGWACSWHAWWYLGDADNVYEDPEPCLPWDEDDRCPECPPTPKQILETANEMRTIPRSERHSRYLSPEPPGLLGELALLPDIRRINREVFPTAPFDRKTGSRKHSIRTVPVLPVELGMRPEV